MRRILIALGAAAILLAGCSHSAQPQIATAGGQSSSAPATDPDTRLQQYAQCLRQHGLHVTDPTPGQAGVRLDPNDPPDKAAAGVQACLAFADGGAAPTPPSSADLAQLRKYAQCMRDHKVTAFPDPDPKTGYFTGLTKSNYNPADPIVKAAIAACQALAPVGTPGG
jgi:hypothetical protein